MKSCSCKCSWSKKRNKNKAQAKLQTLKNKMCAGKKIEGIAFEFVDVYFLFDDVDA